MKPPRPRSHEEAVRQVSELNALYWSLPRILTKHEEGLWPRFEAFATGADEPLTIRELVRCCQIAWKWKRDDLILGAASRLSQETIDSDRELGTWIGAARFMAQQPK